MGKNESDNQVERPPVIVVMGHIDHGKSTLLDYIRKTNVTEQEAGGITQHISAYEITHEDEEGDEKQITFLDTPGHEAFSAMRSRGAEVADIAILVVAADDGVKPQTKEAYEAIKQSELPFIVAINKIDKPEANPEEAKNELVENEIYIEGYGGDTPAVDISAKTGENVDELLDMILLVAELEELTADPAVPAEGVVVETFVSPKRGTSATLLITDGTLKKGMYVQASEAVSPTRIIENFKGEEINEARFSSPVRVTGFDTTPTIGALFNTFEDKADAEEAAQAFKENQGQSETDEAIGDKEVTIPVLIKSDVAGSIDAIKHELSKLETDRVGIKIVNTGVGAVSENDIRVAGSSENSAIVVGFNVPFSGSVKELAKQESVTVNSFNVIYDLTKWLEKEIDERTPTITVKEPSGSAKVKKVFSQNGDEQIIGGVVKKGEMNAGDPFTIVRRGEELGDGEVEELQQQKVSIERISSGSEFGARVESRFSIAPGDVLQLFTLVEKK